MTQSELAAKLQTLGINMEQQMLSKIENNSRMVTDYELAGMCLALRVSPAELLTDNSEAVWANADSAEPFTMNAGLSVCVLVMAGMLILSMGGIQENE